MHFILDTENEVNTTEHLYKEEYNMSNNINVYDYIIIENFIKYLKFNLPLYAGK